MEEVCVSSQQSDRFGQVSFSHSFGQVDILPTLYSALGEVQAILKRYIELKDGASAMYKKNLSLALLETTFRLPATTLNPNHDNSGLSPRVVQLGLFLDQYFERLSAFDDIKGYVAGLSFEEVKALMEDVLPNILDEVHSFSTWMSEDN
jgi:hypothetical protein